MFPIKYKPACQRDGISIIEVLTSMAVATIGVFGVMVMVPFAVKQSQTGLDFDAANAAGRNAVEQLQINGLLQLRPDSDFSRLVIDAVEDGGDPLVDTRFIQPLATEGFDMRERAPGVFHFDPIGFAAGLRNFTIDLTGNGLSADDLTIHSASANRLVSVDVDNNGTLDLPGGNYPSALGDLFAARKPLTTREAARLCRSSDEQFYETSAEGIDQIAPPQPLFNRDGTIDVKRQSSGRISWSTFLVPEKDLGITGGPANRFRSHTLVYRDRFLDNTSTDLDPLVRFRTLLSSNYSFARTNMAVAEGEESYVESVNRITLDLTDEDFIIPAGVIFRDDWIMLVNRISLPDPDPAMDDAPLSIPVGTPPRRYRAADNGYRIQLGFAKVTRVGLNPTPIGLTPAQSIVTSVSVDGGAFDFVPADVGGSTETYMVHLNNVVNVYERSVSVER